MPTGALSTLHVVDLTTMISGGFASTTLADFGADGVPVEHPTKPDPTRSWKPRVIGESVRWKSLDWNQRCVTLDLSDECGQTLARELVADADIVPQSFRSGTMEQCNLGTRSSQGSTGRSS